MLTRDYLANRTPVPTGTLTQLLFESVDRFGDRVAFRGIREGGFTELTYRQVLQKARAVAAALHEMGLTRGDRIGLLSDNRVEWSQTDYGALCAGVPVVPVHSTLTAAQAAYVIRDSGARLVFTSGGAPLEKTLEAVGSCPEVIRVVCFDPPPEDAEGVMSWKDFLEVGRRRAEEQPEKEFRERALTAGPHDCATILYTSGTTGDPKGVVLTHNNLYSNVKATTAVIPFDETDTTLSFLPLSHILQRLGDYLFFSSGSTIVYARSMKTIAEDLLTACPTKVIAPPRFYEKSYQKVMEQRGLRGLVVRWAREVGEAWTEERLAGREPTWILKLVYRVADSLVFEKVRAGLGGRAVFFISGSAPLAPEINKFFFSAGIRILEGYGLSETSPVATANTLEDFQIGTVGPPIPGTEIRIAEDGEILIRGPQVMKEYFNRPAATAEAITKDGWFITGDIGEIDEEGHLRITDRKKNLLVTTGGKNIAPAPIENRIKGNRFVDQVVMIGDQRHFPALLVVPAFEALEPWAAAAGIVSESRRDLLMEPRVQEHMKREVFGSLGDLASFETPKKLGLIEEEFTIEGGILTPNQKVKRRVVGERYGALIEGFYNPAYRDRTVFVNGEEDG
ncbi:MAG: AMP-dependent synthetase/ligase [Longimicrobiales bacterium]